MSVLPAILLTLLTMLQPSDTTALFPAVQGRNLNGVEFTLPKDFAGDLNVVFIAFQREQQADVDSWTPALTKLVERHPTLRVYELPTLGRRYRLMRPIIDGGMRGGIPDPDVRAATITLYIDKGPFKRRLGFSSEERIQVLLVDREGRIRWQRSGSFSESMRVELESHIRP